MELSSLLTPEAVRSASTYSSKKRLFQELGELAGGLYGISSADTCSAFLEREALGPTGVGKGIALPHARIAGLTEIHAMFFKVEKPMDFGSVDRQPVDLIFALLAPQDSGVDHLKALALVSRTMRDPNLCTKLRANNDPATLHTLLVSEQGSQAA